MYKYFLSLIVLIAIGCTKKPPVVIDTPEIIPAVVEKEEPEKDIRDYFEDEEPFITPSSPVIYFDLDEYFIRDDQREKMGIMIDMLGGRDCTIEGHACELGTHEYNLTLGEHRASTVMQWLVAAGYPSERLNIISYGEERPATQELIEFNRRVEIKCQ